MKGQGANADKHNPGADVRDGSRLLGGEDANPEQAGYYRGLQPGEVKIRPFSGN